MLALRRGYRRLVPVHRHGAAEYPDVCAGGTTSRSCRRTPRVSPLLQLGATLTSSPLGSVLGCELCAVARLESYGE